MDSTTVDYKDYHDIKVCGTDEQKEAMLKYTNAWYKMFPFSTVRFEMDFGMDSIIIRTNMYIKGSDCAFRRMVSSLIFPKVTDELLKEASSEYIERVMSI